jgi:membrane fusion protein, copper/silver efflux system
MDRTPLDPRPAPAPPPSHHEPPRGAGAMNVVRWALLVVLVLLAGASFAGWWMSRDPASPTAAAGTVYYCPMHPSYTSANPKDECPICGMDLVPATAKPVATGGATVPGLAPVELTPERIQLIGVRTALVERRAIDDALELVGFVAPDEGRLHTVQLRVSGWVQDLAVSRTGETVRAGAPLLTLYSPELFQSEQEFLIALGAGAAGHSGAAHEGDAVDAARRRLRLLGVPASEIERLERERKAATQLTLPSPVTGTVLARGVTTGQMVTADTPLFTVADLSRVWVVADLYEMDLGRVRVGDRARFVTDGTPARSYEGRIEFVAPTVSGETRTVQARLGVDNPGGLLRPGMYGRVHVRGRGIEALTLPSDAVVQTGASEYVFLARAGGRFEPRLVETGVRGGDRIEIRSGVAAGDTVVSGASFLIDSESRLKAAIAGIGAQPTTGSHEGHGGAK